MVAHHRRRRRMSSPGVVLLPLSTAASRDVESKTDDDGGGGRRRLRRLSALADMANGALDAHASTVLRTFHARVGVVVRAGGGDDDDRGGTGGCSQAEHLRLGLVATKAQSGDDKTIAALPYDGGLALAAEAATTSAVFRDALPEGYDGWTGDVGLLAMLLLNEMARCDAAAAAAGKKKGVDIPVREGGARDLMSAWISTLPSHVEMRSMHPLMWDEMHQEILQNSSTKKVYRLLDDVDDDSSWLDEKVWSGDRVRFPETVSIRVGPGAGADDDDGAEVEERPCFSPAGFRYAVSLVRSRSFYVDGSLRLLPYLDYANHDDYGTREIGGGSVGTGVWGLTTKGALLRSGKALDVGDEVRVSYGPKGPADYLLDHGFVPPMCRIGTTRSGGGSGSAVTSELTFEVDGADRFRDDKLDVLEHDTYDLAPMEPSQSFDVAGGPGSTGEPDPAMMQFLRLAKLGGKDAFLLESIFRQEVWGFMSEPVSEDNERMAVNAVIDACRDALSEMMTPEGGEEGGGGGGGSSPSSSSSSEMDMLCSMVRESEREALDRTLLYMKQEAEALDLKVYYQERRLKSLGLDSDWTPEDEFGATRLPGAANYDW